MLGETFTGALNPISTQKKLVLNVYLNLILPKATYVP